MLSKKTIQKNNETLKNESNILESFSITEKSNFSINDDNNEEKTYERKGPLIIPASALQNQNEVINKQFNNDFSTINNISNFDEQLDNEDEQIISYKFLILLCKKKNI